MERRTCMGLLSTIILLSTSITSLSQKLYTKEDFPYTTIPDTVSFDYNEDPVARFDETLKPIWKDEIFPEIDLDNQTFGSPFYYKGVLFIPNSFECAYDASTGRELIFGSAEARMRFKEFGRDTIMSFTGFRGFRSVIVNILSGQKIAELDKQPEAKAPFFLQQNIWLKVEWNGKSSTLIATDISKNTDVWRMPFQKFSLLKTAVINGYVFTADPKYLYAIDLKSGRIAWSIELNVNYLNSDAAELFVDGADGLYAINVSNIAKPSISWKLESENAIVDINYCDDLLYIQRPYNLLAFDRKTKSIRWKANLYSNFYPTDQLGVTDDFLVSTNTDDEKYNLVYDRRTGRLISSNLGTLSALSFSKTGNKNIIFGISDRGQWVHSFRLESINK